MNKSKRLLRKKKRSLRLIPRLRKLLRANLLALPNSLEAIVKTIACLKGPIHLKSLVRNRTNWVKIITSSLHRFIPSPLTSSFYKKAQRWKQRRIRIKSSTWDRSFLKEPKTCKIWDWRWARWKIDRLLNSVLPKKCNSLTQNRNCNFKCRSHVNNRDYP